MPDEGAVSPVPSTSSVTSGVNSGYEDVVVADMRTKAVVDDGEVLPGVVAKYKVQEI